MKILYSCLSKSWGGMEMVTLTWIKQLLKYNINIELLCVDESRLQIEANNLGIIIHTLKSIKTFNPFSILKAVSILKSGNYNLIHSHSSKDLWFIVPALNLLNHKTPLVFTKHVGSFIIKKDFLHNTLYNRVTKAIAISSVIKKNLIDTTALTDDKIKIIFNGVDLTKFKVQQADRKKLRNELNLSEETILIGMTARFSPGKGHEEFLLSASLLNEKFSNLYFIVVGEASRGEDEYSDKIKKLAKSYDLKNLKFLGYRTDMPDVLAAMDIFVFPSHAEAFGIALIEAMAMARASVSAGSDGVLDITIDNETGLLFKPRDANDLTEKISLLISDPNKRKALGDNAVKRVKEVFDLEQITNQTINLYLELNKKL